MMEQRGGRGSAVEWVIVEGDDNGTGGGDDDDGAVSLSGYSRGW